jgi:hypothetical protein
MVPDLSKDYTFRDYTRFTANDILALMLSVGAFFINPFYVLISVTMLQVYVKIRAIFFLPLFCVSLALHWSLRKIGVEWEGGFDDVVWYIESFRAINVDTIFTLFQKYFESPGGNELVYNVFVYCIRLTTSNERVFLFATYFLMLILLSIGAVHVSKRYYLIIISLVFFGLGGFVEQAALHLLRATLAALTLFVAIAIYDRRSRTAWALLLTAPMVHTAVVPLVIFYIIINNSNYLSRLLPLIFFSLFIAVGIRYAAQSLNSILLASSKALYLNAGSISGTASELISLLGIIVTYIIINSSGNKSILKFPFFITCLLFFIYLFLPEYSFIAGRYFYVIQLFTALLLFKIVMSIKLKSNWMLCAILLVLFTKKMIALSNSEFINGAFDNFSNLFSAPFFVFLI